MCVKGRCVFFCCYMCVSPHVVSGPVRVWGWYILCESTCCLEPTFSHHAFLHPFCPCASVHPAAMFSKCAHLSVVMIPFLSARASGTPPTPLLTCWCVPVCYCVGDCSLSVCVRGDPCVFVCLRTSTSSVSAITCAITYSDWYTRIQDADSV